ncbi:MAG: hypothetical protein EXR71_05115 [Myxococcales bacterium]|nr:hypothetical protein [Myxococcales bacterium]
MESLREELQIESELVPGRGGVFTIEVDGRTVAKKTIEGFPTTEDIVRSVAQALAQGSA